MFSNTNSEVIDLDKSTRCLNILNLLQNDGAVNVSTLATQFDTSEMTIRRDLNFLAKQYNIKRTHGGAIMSETAQPVVRMVSFDYERITNKEEKELIAQRAAQLVQPRQRIFIDAGSTTRNIIDYIDPNSKNVIVTNSLTVAQNALKMENLSVIMLGGEMIPISNCSCGYVAEEQIKKYQLDIAFLGAAAIGTDGRLYDGYSPEARLKGSIFSLAKSTYLLADSTKFNTYDLNDFGSLSKVNGVITDHKITKEELEFIKKYNIDIIVAE